MSSGVLVYDSFCGPCTNFKNIVSFLNTRGKLSFASLTEADELGLLDRLPKEMRYRSFHLIGPGQETSSGAEAIPGLLGLILGGKRTERAIFSIPFGFQAISSVYRVLSRLHDSGSCVPPRLGALGTRGASGLGLRPKQN